MKIALAFERRPAHAVASPGRPAILCHAEATHASDAEPAGDAMPTTDQPFPSLRPLASIAVASLLAGAAALGPGGCAASPATVAASEPTHAETRVEMTCPITGEPVGESSPSALYGIYPVRCASVADAKQFASLSPARRAAAAAPQVLPQKRIANRTCPLTGEPLTAAAAPVEYEGRILGFASMADANQFRSLAKDRKAALVAEWDRLGEPATTR